MNLEKYCEIKEELKNIELILQELNTQLYNIRRSNITDMPKARGSYTNNKIVNLIKKIDIEKEKYIKKYEECFDEYGLVVPYEVIVSLSPEIETFPSF